MTQLERSMSKTAFAALERIRRARGIRSRQKALELVLLELAPDEDEVDGVIVHSPEDAAIFAARVASAKAGNTIPAEEVWKMLEEKRKRSVP
jgi:hypothetical protein